jgi:hypothetical protein
MTRVGESRQKRSDIPRGQLRILNVPVGLWTACTANLTGLPESQCFLHGAPKGEGPDRDRAGDNQKLPAPLKDVPRHLLIEEIR